MDWTLLGIAPTTDKNTITAAYRAQLARTNPEDDPEGFKALRAAYEQALQLAEQAEQPAAQDDSPLGLWKGKLRALYDDFPARIDPERWQELLHDPVCTALDTHRQIGLTVSSSGMLLPGKSVTALIGVADAPQPKRARGCQHCTMFRNCAYRKEGIACGK